MIWDSFKAAARSFIINFVSQKKKFLETQFAQLLNKIKQLEYTYYQSNESSLKNLIDAKLTFNRLSTDAASNYLLKCSSRYYGGQNKMWKLLANFKNEKRKNENRIFTGSY